MEESDTYFFPNWHLPFRWVLSVNIKSGKLAEYGLLDAGWSAFYCWNSQSKYCIYWLNSTPRYFQTNKFDSFAAELKIQILQIFSVTLCHHHDMTWINNSTNNAMCMKTFYIKFSLMRFLWDCYIIRWSLFHYYYHF